MNPNICQKDQRRERVRAKAGLNGLDYLDVSGDQLKLTVYFLGKAPEHLTEENFRVGGGRRIRDIKILHAETVRDPDPELDDTVTLTLDRYGDFSTYTLHLVNVLEPIDPFYDRLDFTFKVDCPSDLDCRSSSTCPPARREEPDINYLAKDYASFRQLILDRLALNMPGWKEQHVPDIGVALVEVCAYVGDHLSYYQDAVATEAYLDTARKRISVRRHARLVDYLMHEGCNARAWVCLRVEGTVQLNPEDLLLVTNLKDGLQTDEVVISRDELRNAPPNSFVAFEPLVADRTKLLEVREEHNSISFYTWGQRECCLPRGSTSATLLDRWVEGEEPPIGQMEVVSTKAEQSNAPRGTTVDERARALNLRKGEVIIFEEVRGPKTGVPADADPAHRHAVRLTSVRKGVDPLDQTPVLEIEWSRDDALPFALCLSSISDSEHCCVYHEDVSIAHGNVVLVDHGESREPEEDLGTVQSVQTKADCDCELHPSDVTELPTPFAPTLAKSPLTYGQPVDYSGPASAVLKQDPRKALPLVRLNNRQATSSSTIEPTWEPRFDLLGSSGDDMHFVVETDNDGRAHLRFGDGDCGRMPEAGLQFSAHYRVGNGEAGNVGPGAIAHLVYRNEKPGGTIKGVRNPLPAKGGRDPEPVKDVKLFAPTTFRKQLERAVTADDYARIAARNPRVDHAGAVLRWNGSWYEVQVAIDPKGGTEVSDELMREIENDLRQFRRIGHDLRVGPARYVWLDIALKVCVRPEYQRGHVKAALLDRFSTRSLPGGKMGFFHPDNLTFGDAISGSRLVAAALEVEGVESVNLARLERQYEPSHHELEDGVLPIGPLEIARCDNDPTFPEHGRIQLDVGGGR